MDLRIYTKSGNDYYVDISDFQYDDIIDRLMNAVYRGDMLRIRAESSTHVFKGEEVEYFVIEEDEETEGNNE